MRCSFHHPFARFLFPTHFDYTRLKVFVREENMNQIRIYDKTFHKISWTLDKEEVKA